MQRSRGLVRAGMVAVCVSLMALAMLTDRADAAESAAEKYTIDRVHSSVRFTISHLMVSKTAGAFNEYDGEVQFDPQDLAHARFEGTIKVASIDTRNQARDQHLKSGDFFAADKFPEILFRSRKVVLKSGNDYLVTGDLTMKGVTREVELPVTVLGPVPNPMGGGQVLGIESHFTINRQDYGVSWNKLLDNGGLMIGNEVQVSVLIEAHRQ